MAEQLTCTKIVKRDAGRDSHNKPVVYHEKCGAPASEVEIGGTLTTAKAILCAYHKAAADREAFVSSNGFPKGKVNEKAKQDGYQQTRLPGAGVRYGL